MMKSKSKYISVLLLAFLGILPVTANEKNHHVMRAVALSTATDLEKDLEVNIPKAEGEIRNELVISIDQKGSVKMHGEAFTLDALQIDLGKRVKVNPGLPIRIKASAKTDFKNIVQVIDCCRKAGVWNISFATKSQKLVDSTKVEKVGQKLPPVIVLNAKGIIIMDGKVMTEEILTEKLLRLAKVNKNQVIEIRCSEQTRYKYIEKVKQCCSMAKLENVIVTVDRATSDVKTPKTK